MNVIGFAGWSGSGKTTLIEKLIPVIKNEAFRNESRIFAVGVIKHDAHGISLTPVFPENGDAEGLYLDREGKDSWRFRRAGADRVILCGPEGMLISCEVIPEGMRPSCGGESGSTEQGRHGLWDCGQHDEAAYYMKQLPLPDHAESLAAALPYLQDMDLILVEGYRNGSMPQIGIARKDSGKGLTDGPDRFLAVVTDDPEIREACCGTEGNRLQRQDRGSAVPVFGMEQIHELARFLWSRTEQSAAASGSV